MTSCTARCYRRGEPGDSKVLAPTQIGQSKAAAMARGRQGGGRARRGGVWRNGGVCAVAAIPPLSLLLLLWRLLSSCRQNYDPIHTFRRAWMTDIESAPVPAGVELLHSECN